MVRLFRDSSKTSVFRIMKVKVWHPVHTFVGLWGHRTASGFLGLCEVHTRLEAVGSDDRVNMIGGLARTEDRVQSLNHQGHSPSLEEKVSPLLSSDWHRKCSQERPTSEPFLGAVEDHDVPGVERRTAAKLPRY